MSIYPERHLEELYENQRWILSWNRALPTDRYPYSDITGHVERSFDTAAPAGSHWDGPWTLIINPGTGQEEKAVAALRKASIRVSLDPSVHATDPSGWMYARDYPSSSWYPSKKMTTVVRRRLWRRWRVVLPQGMSPPPAPAPSPPAASPPPAFAASGGAGSQAPPSQAAAAPVLATPLFRWTVPVLTRRP